MNRVDIIVLDCSKLCTDDTCWEPFISPLRKKKLDKITHINTKKLSLGVELALAAALTLRHLPSTPPEYFYDEFGKPRFNNNHHFFSLSHSKNLAVCAISNEEIGTDIEHHRHISDSIGHFTLSPDEKECSPEEILRKWVAKESYLKLTGSGIKLKSMQQITAKNNLIIGLDGNNLAHCHISDKIASDGYDKYIIGCCGYSEFDINITELSNEELAQVLQRSNSLFP